MTQKCWREDPSRKRDARSPGSPVILPPLQRVDNRFKPSAEDDRTSRPRAEHNFLRPPNGRIGNHVGARSAPTGPCSYKLGGRSPLAVRTATDSLMCSPLRAVYLPVEVVMMIAPSAQMSSRAAAALFSPVLVAVALAACECRPVQVGQESPVVRALAPGKG